MVDFARISVIVKVSKTQKKSFMTHRIVTSVLPYALNNTKGLILQNTDDNVMKRQQ